MGFLLSSFFSQAGRVVVYIEEKENRQMRRVKQAYAGVVTAILTILNYHRVIFLCV